MDTLFQSFSKGWTQGADQDKGFIWNSNRKGSTFKLKCWLARFGSFWLSGRVFRPLLILARGHSQFLAMWAFSMAGLLHLNQQGRESMKSPSKTEITILEGTSHPLPYPIVWKWVIGPLSYSRWRVWMPRGSNSMGIANIQQSRRTHD